MVRPTIRTRVQVGYPAEFNRRAHTGPVWGSYSYAFGPLVALVVLGVLVLLLRWTFKRGGSLVTARGREDQYGMLTPVASPADYITGEMQRQKLADEGIRATLASTLDGPRILVFRADLEAARRVLSGP